LIGLGASAISRFGPGYVQNAAATAAYLQQINAGRLAGARGHAFTAEDQLRGRAIEMLMCDFQLDRKALDAEHGSRVAMLDPITAELVQQYGGLVEAQDGTLSILPHGRPLTRMIASAYDAHLDVGRRFSRAS
jgi:oxygen-independent coproporphyrinogen-3 oxidase